MRFAFEPALERFRDAGVDVEGDLVRLDRGFVAEQLAEVPSSSGSTRGTPSDRSWWVATTSRSRRRAGRRSSSIPSAAGDRRREDHATFVRSRTRFGLRPERERDRRARRPAGADAAPGHGPRRAAVVRQAVLPGRRDVREPARLGRPGGDRLRWPRGDRRAAGDARHREPDQPAVVRRAYGRLRDRVCRGRAAGSVHAVRVRRRDGPAGAWRARSRRWRRRCWQACASCSSSGRATRS